MTNKEDELDKVEGADAAESEATQQETDQDPGEVLSAGVADLEIPAELTEMSQQELASALVEARDQISEMQDGFLRAKAEMENVRRRAQKEVVSARKFAIEGFAQELLNVKDSLDQAAMVELEEQASEAVVNMKEGLGLTLKQFESAMSKFSVIEVEAGPGVKFDPELHQAISMVPSEDTDSNHIIAVMQKGFQLKDRLLRPAMVVVAS